MADVFISYAREDRPHAERLARALQAAGFTVWWDVEDLSSGLSFNRAIQLALEASKRVVVLWSGASIRSDYVEAEAYWAWKNKKLHSVQLGDGVVVPVPFNTSHARNLAAWDGSPDFPELRRLIADLGRIIGARAPAPADPPLSKRADTPAAEMRVPKVPEPEPEMVRIQPGTFLMGSPEGEGFDQEHPQHEVCIARPFAIGRYPMTFEEYEAFAKAVKRQLPGDEGWGRGRRPVINVSWQDAVACAQWLSGQTGRRYRLPSEAEWEYAARAGTETRWSFGDEESELEKYAWYDGNSEGGTHPVGEKEPNPWDSTRCTAMSMNGSQDCWHGS